MLKSTLRHNSERINGVFPLGVWPAFVLCSVGFAAWKVAEWRRQGLSPFLMTRSSSLSLCLIFFLLTVSLSIMLHAFPDDLHYLSFSMSSLQHCSPTHIFNTGHFVPFMNTIISCEWTSAFSGDACFCTNWNSHIPASQQSGIFYCSQAINRFSARVTAWNYDWFIFTAPI